MKPEDTIDFHVRWAWLKISKMYNQVASNHGLTQSTGFILLNIDPKNGTPSTQLGPMMGMEPTSLSRTLKSMEEKGWIFKKQDELDKRVSRICLSDEGYRLREFSKKTVLGFNQKLLKEVGEDRFRHFKEVVQIIDRQTVNQGI
tara:strand:+ start:1187 stop:1618 length:432 start_codon:yes stop_codon:yes gene_type:complete